MNQKIEFKKDCMLKTYVSSITDISLTHDYKILDEEISSEQYGIGFKKGNEQLRDKIQQTLDEMEADGTIAKIASKYDSYGVPGSLIKNNNTTTNTTN